MDSKKEKHQKKGKEIFLSNAVSALPCIPSVKSMGIHYESKHPKEDWETVKANYEAEFNSQIESSTTKK